MQIDFHYYATYCLARSAGIKKKAAQTIAHTAQYVDDSTARIIDDHHDGSRVVAVATAHHTMDFRRNLDHDDQRYVWVPFHFLPGGKGKKFTEKMVCQKNSKIAQEMVEHNLNQLDLPYFLELAGITAHVYADTFSHYGFSGISSRRNRVDGSTIKIEQSSKMIDQVLEGKLASFFKKYGNQGGLLKNIRSIISSAGEIGSGALGHGAVSVYPDQPFLEWSFEYEHTKMTTGKRAYHNNPKTFLEACHNMHDMFSLLSHLHHKTILDAKAAKPFSEIVDTLKEILAVEEDKHGRIKAWKKAAKAGKLYNKKETIPEYDPHVWEKQRDSFTNLTKPKKVVRFEVYKFYQAASFHKHYVLRELLPKYGIVVI